MAYEGSLAESPFPEVLLSIGRNAETGILTLQGKEEIIGVTFLDGAVVSVDAVNQAPEDGLGFVLEESGLVERDHFTSLVAENQAGGGRVIDLLVERGYLNRTQLLAALRQQTLRLCGEACAWKEGQFRFYRGDQVSYEHGIEPVEVDDLLARLAVGEDKGGIAESAPAEVTAEASRPEISRLEDMEPERPEIELLDLPPPVIPTPAPIEMPDVESWHDADDDDLDFEPATTRRKLFDFDFNWANIVAPLMPGRMLGVGMLVSLTALVVLAPERFLVPLDGQARIRSSVAAEVRDALYIKVDQAAKTFFLLRGSFPDRLSRLVDLDLLADSDMRLARQQDLAYTPAPVSYQLAVEGELRLESTIQTETIGGNFLLDPDFSPPEIADTPPLVLLD